MTRSDIASVLNKYYWKHDWDGFKIEDMFDEVHKLAHDIKAGKTKTDADLNLIERGFSVLSFVAENSQAAKAAFEEAKSLIS